MQVREPTIEPDRPIVLEGIGWETYESLLRDYETRPSVRLAYDDGRLEIKVLSYGHERKNKTLGQLIVAIAVELNIDHQSAGSTTFRRESLRKGFEGDDSYYFTSLDFLRSAEEIDLSSDPPPDLVVEVDVSQSSFKKFSIFSALGIREVWLSREGLLSIHQLTPEGYVLAEGSQFLPGFRTSDLNALLKERDEMTAPAWQHRVREFAQTIRARA